MKNKLIAGIAMSAVPILISIAISLKRIADYTSTLQPKEKTK